MIHSPRLTFHIPPAIYSDKLVSDILECWNTNTLNTTQFSTYYQMDDYRGYFNDINEFKVKYF